MGCSLGAPRLQGTPSFFLFFIIDTGLNIHNEGPQIILAQGPLKAKSALGILHVHNLRRIYCQEYLNYLCFIACYIWPSFVLNKYNITILYIL